MDAYQVRTWHGWHHHMALSLMAVWFLIGETHRGQQVGHGLDAAPSALRTERALAGSLTAHPPSTTSVATYSVNYSATSRRDSTIIAPVSVYHHGSYAETYSRYKATKKFKVIFYRPLGARQRLLEGVAQSIQVGQSVVLSQARPTPAAFQKSPPTGSTPLRGSAGGPGDSAPRTTAGTIRYPSQRWWGWGALAKPNWRSNMGCQALSPSSQAGHDGDDALEAPCLSPKLTRFSKIRG